MNNNDFKLFCTPEGKKYCMRCFKLHAKVSINCMLGTGIDYTAYEIQLCKTKDR